MWSPVSYSPPWLYLLPFDEFEPETPESLTI